MVLPLRIELRTSPLPMGPAPTLRILTFMLFSLRCFLAPRFSPWKPIDCALQFIHVDVCIAQNHPLALPAAQLHQSAHVAIGCVVPRRPGVTAVMRAEVNDLG